MTWKVSRMASHLFSRPSSDKSSLRNRLRRVLLESLERREMMAADIMDFNDLGAPISYTLAGQASQKLAFQTTGDLSNMSPDDVTNYLDTTFGSTGGDLTSRAWFPLIQESYSKWSQQNGLAFSYTSGLVAEGEGGLVAEGEAGGPRLLSVAPNSGNIFSFNNVNTITEAPTELVFRFDGSNGLNLATVANGIKLIRAGRDGAFGDANDQTITPGFLGFGDNNRIVVMRFATTLPDDLYRVVVIGADNGLPAPLTETAIRNTAGLRLDNRLVDSTPADTTRDTVDFKLELGALVKAVVPQPVDRFATSTVTLSQTGGSFVLEVRQSDLADNVTGTSVGLRLVQGTGATTSASYDKTTNRVTVSLATAGDTVAGIVAAINSGSNGLAGNFRASSAVGGTVNALDLNNTPRTISFTNWTLDPKRDQIRVYFNNDDLLPSSATNPLFYQLILTADTVQPQDDTVITPSVVNYDPVLDVVVLTFPQLLTAVGTYRLRVGGNDVVANNSSLAAQKTITPISPADPWRKFWGRTESSRFCYARCFQYLNFGCYQSRYYDDFDSRIATGFPRQQF